MCGSSRVGSSVWQAHGPARIHTVMGRPAKVQSRPRSMKKVGQEKAYLMKVCSAGSAQNNNPRAERLPLHDCPVAGRVQQIAAAAVHKSCCASATRSSHSTEALDSVRKQQIMLSRMRHAYGCAAAALLVVGCC